MSTPTEDLTPLQMAQNAAVNVLRIADAQEADPLEAYITGAWKQGRATAQVGACMALVSIAESLDRIADELTARRLGGHR